MPNSVFPTYTIKAQIKTKVVRSKKGDIKPISDLQDPEYVLVTRDSDVEEIHKYHPESKEYDGFLIAERNGEYIQVWGFNGTPYLDKRAERVA